MKKQIKELKNLAESCQVYAKKINIKTNAITSFKSDSIGIDIYSGSSDDTISVYFYNELNTIHVSLYSDQITFPMSMKINQIKEGIVEWSKMVNDDFSFELEKYELQKKMIIQSRIDELQSELDNLKNE